MGNRSLSADRRELIKSLNYLGSWCLIALVGGILGVVLTGGFLFALDKALNSWVNLGWHIILVAVSGALLAGIISRIEPESRGEGIPSYIRGVEENGGYLSFKATIVKLFSSLATLATWGNGGIVGPIGRVTAGLTSTLVGLFRSERSDFALRRTAAICGMASVLAVVTGAPIGSGIFAVEIAQRRNMRYGDIFPAVLSSSFAVFLSGAVGIAPLWNIEMMGVNVGFRHLPALLTTILLAAAGGRLFEIFYGTVSGFLRREAPRGVEARFVLATFIAVAAAWAVNPLMVGTGREFMNLLLTDPSTAMGRLDGLVPLFAALLVMILIRSLAVGLTVGSGQSAGFFAPLAQIGMLIGTLSAVFFGFGGAPDELRILQSAGMAGILAGTLNIPIAAAVISVEIFGPDLGLPVALAAVLGFQVNRHHTVYDAGPGGHPDL